MRHRTLDPKTKQLLQHRAKLQRANPSWPEQLLWQALRSGQLGVPFRRQVVVVPGFIVDFVAAQAKLVVEVDGKYHQLKRASDARRDRKLARLGYRVLRLEAQLVLTALPVALARVRQALAKAGVAIARWWLLLLVKERALKQLFGRVHGTPSRPREETAVANGGILFSRSVLGTAAGRPARLLATLLFATR